MVATQEVLKLNPWDEIYSKGVPDDLIDPYPGLYYILQYAKENGITKGKALDVAMGAGRHSFILYDKGYEVCGFDLSRVALDIAKTESQEKHATIATKQADMFEKFPFEDQTFDILIAIQAIYHGYKTDTLSALREMHRTGKHGAIIGVTFSLDNMRSTRGSHIPKIQEVEPNTFIPRSGRERGLPHYYPPEYELNEMTKGLFEDVRYVEDNEYNYRVLLGRNK